MTLEERLLKLEQRVFGSQADEALKRSCEEFERVVFLTTLRPPDVPGMTVDVERSIQHRRTAPRKSPYQIVSDEYVLEDGRVVTHDEIFAAARAWWQRDRDNPYWLGDGVCLARQFAREAARAPDEQPTLTEQPAPKPPATKPASEDARLILTGPNDVPIKGSPGWERER
jgi:hypothetical protein